MILQSQLLNTIIHLFENVSNWPIKQKDVELYINLKKKKFKKTQISWWLSY